ncbi:TRAPPC8 [Acrasis kona]|uniref:TRAPPC8 n=1 Tax=Acrasis kona TaxID=1008807 RepID=A0AAW2ZMC9_9EUKA
MGDLKASTKFMHDYVATSTQLPENQKRSLNEFLETVRTFTKENIKQGTNDPNNLDYLDVPKFNTSTIRVLLNQYGEPSHTDEIPQGNWRRLERQLVKSIRGKMYLFPWDNPSNLNKRKNACVVGEPVLVEVSVSNPLYIPLNLSLIRLTATFENKPTIKDDVIDTSRDDDHDGSSNQSPKLTFKADPISLTLAPRESKLIRLPITALMEGELTITGLRFQIEHTAEGTRTFHLKGRRLNDTKIQRTNQIYEEDNRTIIKCIPQMPLLLAHIEDQPSVLYAGQILERTLVIKNIGNLPMKGLICRMSHPQLFCVGRDDSNDKNHDSSNDGNEHLVQIEELTNAHDESRMSDLSIVKIKLNDDQDVLQPDSQISIPIYIRAHSPSEITCRFLFYYEPTSGVHDMRFRLYRMEFPIKILESLHLNVTSHPSVRTVDERIMSVSIKNDSQNVSMQLNALVSLSPTWGFVPLNKKLSNGDLKISPQESMVMHFRVFKLPLQSGESVQPHYCNLQLASKNLFCNVFSSCPHVDFLYRDCVLLHETAQSSSTSPLAITTDKNRLQVPVPASSAPSPSEPFDKKKHMQKQKSGQFGQAMGLMARAAVVDEDEPDEPPRFFFLEDQGMSLQLFWNVVDQEEVYGQSHFLKVEHVPLVPLTIALKYEEKIVHDFQKMGPVCLSDVCFTIMNASPNLVCNFTLELISLPSLSTFATGNNQTHSGNNLVWMGSTRVQSKSLAPGNALQIPVKACFFSPGHYNLNQFRVTWTKAKTHEDEEVDPPIIMSFNDSQFLVCVQDGPVEVDTKNAVQAVVEAVDQLFDEVFE